MYEEDYESIRVVQEGEETQIVAQNEEPFSIDALTELFDQMRQKIVAFEEPIIGKNQRELMKRQSQKNLVEITAFKAILMVYNKERREKIEEEKAVMLSRDKLAMLCLEQKLRSKINEVDCLEERIFVKEL
ncbi:hypothetical protein Adt_06019 [Abeliophyllum distichum]|uniref:Uncharacterized protein n=1 Tax=Abeliophyllum distichum TaxID=126358 RepID=A0ABD1V7X5_9LAMI